MSEIWNLIIEDGYRTGIAFLTAAVALVLMINLGTFNPIRPVAALGAFAFAWFLYNTLTGQTTPLYGDDARLWDVATQGPTGFLIISVIVGLAAVFVWRFSLNIVNRLLLVTGTLFGVSLIYGMIVGAVNAWQTSVQS